MELSESVLIKPAILLRREAMTVGGPQVVRARHGAVRHVPVIPRFVVTHALGAARRRLLVQRGGDADERPLQDDIVPGLRLAGPPGEVARCAVVLLIEATADARRQRLQTMRPASQRGNGRLFRGSHREEELGGLSQTGTRFTFDLLPRSE